jgi:hypothetical protein
VGRVDASETSVGVGGVSATKAPTRLASLGTLPTASRGEG